MHESTSPKSKKKALLLTGIAGFLWGTSFPAIKIGLQYMDACTFAFLRFLTASATMLSIALLTRNVSFSFNKKRLVLLLGLANGLAYLLQYMGMVSTTASKSSLFINLSAVWVALLSPLLLKEHLNRKRAVGVATSLIGVVFMTTNLNFESLTQGTIIGDLLVISAGFLWALFIIYNKPLIKETTNTFHSMLWLLLFTLLPLLPAALLLGVNFRALSIDAWLAILYTAMLCWIVPYYLWLKGLKYLSTVTSSIVLLIEVLVAMLIATILLGEVLTTITGIGAIFIIIAILLVS
ncbi:MAG: DMT family transporter [Candidatus Bathyarchaeia archaeon]